MQSHDDLRNVRWIDAKEYGALLVSRRSLERLQPQPRSARTRADGLRDRRTGTIYVRASDPDSTRGSVSLVPPGHA